MKLEQKIEIRLAPTLLQRLDLLTLPLLELQQLIKQELEQNPMLEKEEETDEEFISLEEIEEVDIYPRSTEYEPKSEKELQIPIPKPTLKEHLLSQLRIVMKDEKLIKIGEHIIYELDENGYLPVSVNEIATLLGEDPKTVESVLNQIQEFEPSGVGARNLQECILIQLRFMKGVPKVAFLIVNNFFNDLINQNYQKIKMELKSSYSEIQKAIECIKSCVPKPGKVWEGEASYVLPEVVVEQDEGQLVVSFTDEWLPKLKLSKYYQEMLLNLSELTKEEKDYLKKKLISAKLLLEGIEKRKKTLSAITQYIVNHEIEFLTGIHSSIKFLTLEEVAQAVGRNPSTVSRAIKGKWIQTPKGAFSLKTFFSGGKVKGYSEIMHKIKELIEKENKSTPLSDRQIVEILRQEGFEVARTTIIKYRNQLGIFSADKRKDMGQFFKNY